MEDSQDVDVFRRLAKQDDVRESLCVRESDVVERPWEVLRAALDIIEPRIDKRAEALPSSAEMSRHTTAGHAERRERRADETAAA